MHTFQFNKRRGFALLSSFVLMLFFSNVVFCQIPTPAPQKTKIGIFAPLYLDSIFKNNQYQFGKKFPRFALPGIDFMQGAEIAMDSFGLDQTAFEVYFFDSKSDSNTIDELIQTKQLDGLSLMICAIKDDELTTLAGFAKQKNIPLLSATYPNDAGITNNPYFIILNPTLKSHCEAIFSYLVQSHSEDKIMLVRQSGSQEDRVADYFNAINRPDNKPLLPIKTYLLDSNLYLIKNNLDSTKKNIIIGGSLDETFVRNLAIILAGQSKKYDITLIGMPNWDGFATFNKDNKPALKTFPIYYTSPYFNKKTDDYSKRILEIYLNNYKGKPSEYAYKGFELFFILSRLIAAHGNDFINHINDNTTSLFTPLNIQPIKLKKNQNIDYYENKHLFLLKKLNGAVEKVN